MKIFAVLFILASALTFGMGLKSQSGQTSGDAKQKNVKAAFINFSKTFIKINP